MLMRIKPLIIYSGVFSLVLLSQSLAARADFISDQSPGMQKCVRAILGRYEAKGVEVFGHHFNCKPLVVAAGGVEYQIQLSHDQFGLDHQVFIDFTLDQNFQLILGSYSVYTTQGVHLAPRWPDWLPPYEFIGAAGPQDLSHEGMVERARDLENRSGGKTRTWRGVILPIVSVIVAELEFRSSPGNIVANPNCAETNDVRLYRHDNYRDEPMISNRPVAVSDLKSARQEFHDEISSICVSEGFELEVFKHANFSGDRLEFIGPTQIDNFTAQTNGWNDEISSFRVTRR